MFRFEYEKLTKLFLILACTKTHTQKFKGARRIFDDPRGCRYINLEATAVKIRGSVIINSWTALKRDVY
jgi:hypothetical protein